MTSVQRVTEEKDFLRSLNETLLSNQKEFKDLLNAAKDDVAVKEATIKDLQEQVHLMICDDIPCLRYTVQYFVSTNKTAY